jgi:hypothetical protein
VGGLNFIFFLTKQQRGIYIQMLGGALISQAFPSVSSNHRSGDLMDDSNSIFDTMNARQSVDTQQHRRKHKSGSGSHSHSHSRSRSRNNGSRRAAPRQPMDPEVYLPYGGAPLPVSVSPPSRSKKHHSHSNALFCPADGGDMGFASSSMSSLASPFGAEDAIDGMSGLDALDGMDPIEEIDFYQNDGDHADVDDIPINKRPSKKTSYDIESVDDEDEQKPRNHHTASASIDLGIYIISGLFLILLMEQFIQLGTRLRM